MTFIYYRQCLTYIAVKATYPYKNTDPSLTCPTLKSYNQGAKVLQIWWWYVDVISADYKCQGDRRILQIWRRRRDDEGLGGWTWGCCHYVLKSFLTKNTQNWSSNKYGIDIYNMYNNLPIFLIFFVCSVNASGEFMDYKGGVYGGCGHLIIWSFSSSDHTGCINNQFDNFDNFHCQSFWRFCQRSN